MLTVKPSLEAISRRRASAVPNAFFLSTLPVISMKHSSTENCSRRGEYVLQMAMKASEHFLYHSQSPRTTTSPGHFRKAIETGSAVLIPYFFAGMDLAVTMLLLS